VISANTGKTMKQTLQEIAVKEVPEKNIPQFLEEQIRDNPPVYTNDEKPYAEDGEENEKV
jgi:hypothetical protein